MSCSPGCTADNPHPTRTDTCVHQALSQESVCTLRVLANKRPSSMTGIGCEAPSVSDTTCRPKQPICCRLTAMDADMFSPPHPFTLTCCYCSWKKTYLPSGDTRVRPPEWLTGCPNCQTPSLDVRIANRKEILKERLEQFLRSSGHH